MRIASIIVVCFAPYSGILVVGDVLEHCLVVAFGGVYDWRSFAWSNGKSEHRKCSTLHKSITSVN